MRARLIITSCFPYPFCLDWPTLQTFNKYDADISHEQFAIRPTLRNHNVLSRDIIIKQVATIVGPGHKVDLQNYDRLIIVEVYQVSQVPSC